MHKSSSANRATVAILALVILQALIACSAFARPRPPLPLWPEALLNVWRFDDTQWWMPPYPLPSAVDNIEVIESWSGYALRMQGDKPSGQADEDPRIVNSKTCDSAGLTPLRSASVKDMASQSFSALNFLRKHQRPKAAMTNNASVEGSGTGVTAKKVVKPKVSAAPVGALASKE